MELNVTYEYHVFAGGRLDRLHHVRHDEEERRRLLAHPEVRIHLLFQHEVRILQHTDCAVAAPLDLEQTRRYADVAGAVLLGVDGEVPHFAIDLSGPGASKRPDFDDGAVWIDLKQVGAILRSADAATLAYARGLFHWRHRHRFCGACGAVTEVAQGGHVLHCVGCGLDHFPRTDPAVIVLVTHEGRALLGRQPHWPTGLHSLIAGFVEPGESLEEAVLREVHEETGVAARAPIYFGSQPWPFPGSIMIGFRAEAENARIEVDGRELERAAWFERDAVRRRADDLRLPPRLSISRQLIEAWLAES